MPPCASVWTPTWRGIRRPVRVSSRSATTWSASAHCPCAEFTEPQKRLYAAAIKLGIQEKLDQQHRDMLLARRRRLVYGALATISATAAGIVIVVGVLMANKSANEKRQMARAQEVYPGSTSSKVPISSRSTPTMKP